VKKILRNAFVKFLTLHARRRVHANTTIIGITGSVGKTTAKEATAKILSTRFETLASAKSLNSDFGVPLTLLEEESGFSNPLKWLGILFRAEWRGFAKLPHEKIVLELGVDAPGDFPKLLKIIEPQVGVFLNTAPVHLENFKNVEEIAAEKGLLISNLPAPGVAILNADDEFSSKAQTHAKKIFFGTSEKADLRAFSIQEDLGGISAKIKWRNETAELRAPVIGRQNLPSLLAAITVGIIEGIGLKKCVEALKHFRLPPGRLNLLEGINGSRIIDGSYNSNPTSLEAALETLGKLKAGRKIAVLGQMNELGKNSEKFHRKAAKKAAEVADIVVAVFGEAKFFATAARAAKKPAEFFSKAGLAGEWLKKEIKTGDLILVKGSQNDVRLEKTIAKILQNPADKKLLCRQEEAWKKR
jgi:UDP-N-acetylmuramyl pentapeptide synthase